MRDTLIMWWKLRRCFFLSRRQSGDSRLIKASASTRAVIGCMNIGFLSTSRTWSKYPLTSISECDESDHEKSVSPSIELVSSDDQQAVAKCDWPVLDLTTLSTSSRFFCSAPGSSSSILEIESSSSPLLLLQPAVVSMVRDSIAVETYSACPYVDFKRSMMEIVEASSSMKETSSSAKWSFLHEMLLCYLALNHKSTHKHIIHAFADLLLNQVEMLPTTNGGK